MERPRRQKGGRELLEKRRGTSASLDWRRAGLADKVGCDAMLDAAGGEATKPQGVGRLTGTHVECGR